MGNWRYRIGLNNVVERLNDEYDLSRYEEPCPEPVREALAAEVQKAPPLRRFGSKLRAARTIAEVNRVLSDVFDAADRDLVWCYDDGPLAH